MGICGHTYIGGYANNQCSWLKRQAQNANEGNEKIEEFEQLYERNYIVSKMTPESPFKNDDMNPLTPRSE